MLIKKPEDIKSSEITPKELYLNRRQFMLSASATAVTRRRGSRWIRPLSGCKPSSCRRTDYQLKEELLQHQREAKLV